MKIAGIRAALMIGAVTAALALSPAVSAGQDPASDRKPKDKKIKSEKAKTDTEDTTKLFQLNPVTIDVIEFLRDKDVPNMTIVKTEFFPMTIGLTLDAALERQPGLDVQRIQEIGTAVDDDSIKIRGLGARRIKVLKNGRPLNSSGVAGGYFIDWTMISLANADRVEIIKGVGDPRYGNVLGGVINLIPKKLTARPGTEVQASYASFNTAALNLYHGFKPGAFEYSLSAGYSRSDGYLRNGDLSSRNVDLHLGYDFSFKGRLTADVGYARIRKGFAVGNRRSKLYGDPLYDAPADPAFPASDGEIMYGGMGAGAEPGSWWDKKKWTADVNYEQALGDRGFLSARYWRNQGDREAFNTRKAAGRTFHKVFFDDLSQGFSAEYRHALPGHGFAFGLDYGHLNDDGDKNLGDDFRAPFRNGSYVSTKTLEFYGMDDIRLAGDKLSIVPGARFLSYQGLAGPQGVVEGIPNLKRAGWAPSLKLTYAYAPGSLAYISAARALRMPAAPEHFWHYDYDSGVDTSGLPFHEEDGLLIQAGWRTVLPGGTQIEVAPYYYRIHRYIQFDLINFVAYNIDRADIYGLEIEASRSFGNGWSAFANYSFQRSRTEGDPFIGLFVNAEDRGFRGLPGLPEHKANVGVQYKTSKGVSAALFAQAISGQKVIYNNNTLYNTDLRLRSQAGFVRLDLEARVPVAKGFEASFFLRNLLDASYQERFGYPAAGRNLGLSIKAGI